MSEETKDKVAEESKIDNVRANFLKKHGVEGPVIGSKNTNEYHRSSCKFAPKSSDIRVEYENVSKAEEAGYSPCLNCYSDAPKREGIIVGNYKNNFYHLPGCLYAPHDVSWRVDFNSIEEAEADKYRPCPDCFPRKPIKKVATVGVGATWEYHIPGSGCLEKYNLIEKFETIEEAEKAGYIPCLICYPRKVKNVVVVGSRDTRLYHLPGCDYEPSPDNHERVEFESVKEAEEEGYRPCRTCCMDAYKKLNIIVANKKTLQYHLPGCEFEPCNFGVRAEFESVKEAEEAGYRPCRDCCRDAYKKLNIIVGSKRTLQYHLPGCEYEPLNPDIRVEFKSKEEADEAGYSPCLACFPEDDSKKIGWVIGSSNTYLFHKKGCKFEPFDSSKRLEFESVLEAAKAGYQPCSECCIDIPKRILPVVGNSEKLIYHTRGCKFEPFKPSKRVEFESIKKAVDAGYRPCKCCCTDVENDNYVVIGSNNTNQFHLLGCDFEPTGNEKRLEFRSAQAALKAGFKPCANCRPIKIEDLDDVEDDGWVEIID